LPLKGPKFGGTIYQPRGPKGTLKGQKKKGPKRFWILPKVFGGKNISLGFPKEGAFGELFPGGSSFGGLPSPLVQVFFEFGGGPFLGHVVF